MRGWTSYLIGLLLLAVASWVFWKDGASGTAILFAALSLIMFFRGAQGQDVTSLEDVTAPIEFAHDPAGSIVDAVVDRAAERMNPRQDKADGAQTGGKGILDAAAAKVGEFLGGDSDRDAVAATGFDPDAVIKRYLADRPEPAADAAPAPARPRFGRKGL